MRRILPALALLLLLAAGCGGAKQRPELQSVLDGLVTGKAMIAPGATAYVSGPNGTWSGAAGLANVQAGQQMKHDARMRLESVSKLWTATVVAKLAEEQKLRLDDTVERWLPGLFPDGKRMTIRELLNHTSGLIDNNDLSQRPGYWLARVHDPELHAELVKLAAALTANPDTVYSTMIEIRTAAALPLLFPPGTQYHYSNIGYQTAGLIAEKAGKAPLNDLYRRIIIEPLGLKSVAYDPNGPIAGPHPVGYSIQEGGKAVVATNAGAGGLGAEGGIVSNAQDEARFLVGLMQGKIVSEPYLAQIEMTTAASGSYGLGTGVNTTCAGTAYMHNGGGNAWASSVAVSGDGKRVAVLLLNGRTADDSGDNTYPAALEQLYCAA